MGLIEFLSGRIDGQSLSYDDTVLVCGAGISFDSGLPLGGGLLERIYADFNLKNELVPFYQSFSGIINDIYGSSVGLFAQPRLEVLFYGIKQILSPLEYDNYILDTLLRGVNSNSNYSVKPNYNHYLISDYIYKGGTCITFNFDELIETAYRDLYHTNLPVVSFPILNYTNGYIDNSLIKAHGSILHGYKSAAKGIGIDIQNLHINGFSEEDNLFLSQRLKGKKNFIFYGYSASDTLDFIPFLKSSFTTNKINVFNLNYISKIDEPSIKKVDHLTQNSGLFQFDHYLKGIIEQLYIVDYNPNSSFANLAPVPEQVSDINYCVDNNILSAITPIKRRLVKLKILEVLGLLNKYGEAEIEWLRSNIINPKDYEEYLHISYYKQNINGFYDQNLLYSCLQLIRKPGLKSCISLYEVLNEYFFLSPRGTWTRILVLPFILLIRLFLTLIYPLIPQDCNYKIRVKRNLYIFSFRLARLFQKNDRISTCIAKQILHRVEQSKEMAISSNSMTYYRFIEKERLKIEFIINKRSDVLLSQLDDLITTNIDTNYFIEIANLLRLKYEITGNQEDKKICERLTELTNDKLNNSKLK